MKRLFTTTAQSAQRRMTSINSQQTEVGPMEQRIRWVINEALAPKDLEVENESHKHRHHVAMRGVESTETHFRVKIVSDKFDGLTLVKRHKEVYALLKDEMEREGGIHALGLVTKTPEEMEVAEKKESY